MSEDAPEGLTKLEGLGELTVRCPMCGHQEETGFLPTFEIGFDAEIDITKVDCDSCGYNGNPWPFDDECVECGGEVSAEILTIQDGQPVEAILRCAGDGHTDDGSDCGAEWAWVHPDVDLEVDS